MAINEILPFVAKKKKKKKLKFQVLARKDAKQLELSSVADEKNHYGIAILVNSLAV